jgi:hypothetical protein
MNNMNLRRRISLRVALPAFLLIAAIAAVVFVLGQDALIQAKGFIAIVITLVGFMPVIMRLSRNIWINLFMSYDKELVKKDNKNS